MFRFSEPLSDANGGLVCASSVHALAIGSERMGLLSLALSSRGGEGDRSVASDAMGFNGRSFASGSSPRGRSVARGIENKVERAGGRLVCAGEPQQQESSEMKRTRFIVQRHESTSSPTPEAPPRFKAGRHNSDRARFEAGTSYSHDRNRALLSHCQAALPYHPHPSFLITTLAVWRMLLHALRG